jgi:signal transduction histidine kinase
VPATAIAGIAEGLTQGVGRMREVINEIISVSRIASGTLDLAIGPVQIGPLVENLLRDFEAVCQQRNMTLHIGDLRKMPIIEGDGTRIKIAFENILGNAIKYTPDGGHIYVVGRHIGDTIDLIVKDTGIGIPPDEHRHIFKQFYVLGSIEHHSTSKSAFQGGGLGLGLAIAMGIIEAHNGRIWVESEKRDPIALPGSTFHILLPIKQTIQQSPNT